jgi:hypothetical protein
MGYGCRCLFGADIIDTERANIGRLAPQIDDRCQGVIRNSIRYRSARSAHTLRHSFLSCPDLARTQTKLRASRKPSKILLFDGASPRRDTDRQSFAKSFQLPPRLTRYERSKGPVGSGPLAADVL